MQITKELEREILEVMQDYWDSYLRGDFQNWASYLPDNYGNIGTTKEEIWSSKKEILDYTERIAEQVTGTAELRNKTTQFIPYQPYIMVHELGDMFLKVEEDWIYYAQFRLTSLLDKTLEGWKILHQHGSYPDAKADVGEAFGFDELKIENKKLQDAITSRTIELERKNRELEIEAALERVRARTMGMQNSEELSEVIQVVYEQMASLNILVDHAGFIMDYKVRDDMHIWLADPGGVPAEVTIPYFDSPHWNSFNEAKKTGSAFFANQLSFEEKNSFYRDLFELIPGVDEATKANYLSCPGLAISTVLLENVGLYIENFSGTPYTGDENATLIRFGKVFQQTYTRFLDLQKAEAQTREAEIENALEKVRSRTMAMQHSNELPDAANVLFLQVQGLGIPAWSCGYNILSADKKSSTCIMSSEGEIQIPFTLPLTEHESLSPWYKAIKNEDEFFVYEQGGEDLIEHYRYMSSLPELVATFKQFEDANIALPTFQVNHLASFTNGFLLFITYERVPAAHDIFKRFAKVFEQTYTRFLDLLKAEAQAREAQIEAALEKVRSRSLAVNRTDEFNEVVTVVFEKLSELEIPVSSVCIAIFKDGTKDWDVFGTGAGEDGLATVNFKLPYFKTPFMDDLIVARSKSEEGYFNKVYSEKDKNHYYEYTLKNTELKNLPDDIKQLIWESKTYAISAAYAKNSSIMVNEFDGNVLDDNQADIIKRFTKVFEQAFIRFLDLQKAEAQTRKAQIEAALDRTRTQSMLMQHSDELDITSKVFHEQLQLLGIDTKFSYVWLPDEANDEHQFWVAWNAEKKGSKAIKSKAIVYPLDKTEPYTAACFEDWGSDESVHIHRVQPSEVETFFSTWEELLIDAKNLTPKFYPDGLYYAEAFMKYGCFGINIKRPVCDEEKQILQRFSVEFERTYTRFLDLKKAEAQAREAQIEAALERLRAASMAMHQSKDLHKVINLVYNQLESLGLTLHSTQIFDDLNDKHTSHFWLSNNVQEYSEQLHIPIIKHAFFTRFHSAMKNGESFFTLNLSKQQKDDLSRIVFENTKKENAPKERQGFIYSMPGLAISAAIGKAAMITVMRFDAVPYLPEENEIIIRFGNVFDQAYTRFLDLKKAEAQAREAQIEAALERVRAQTMAMHNSEDVGKCILKMFSELTGLGVSETTRCGIGILNHDNKNMELWTASKGEREEVNMSIGNLNMTTHPLLQSARNAWKDKKDTNLYILEGEDMLVYYKTINADPGYSAKINMDKLPETIFHYDFVFDEGILFAFSHEALPDKLTAIFQRFSSLFGQTYRRYLDLVNAEAQAREAQIEAALERVRSRSMAMHDSKDLHKVIISVFNQLVGLGLKVHSTQIVESIYDEKIFHLWNAANGQIYPKLIHFPYSRNIFFTRFRTAIENGESFYTLRLTKRQKDSLFKHYFTKSSHQDVPKSRQDFIFTTPGIGASTALGKHTALTVLRYDGILYSNDENEIIKRFATVFEQSYTRFLDLQKAEAQTREALVEASLERVRSRSMAMHKSDELLEAGELLYRELSALGIPSLTMGYVLMEEDGVIGWNYTASPADGKILAKPVGVWHNETKNMKGVLANWKKQQPYYFIEMDANQTITHQTFIAERSINFPYTAAELISFSPERIVLHTFNFKEGYLMIVGSAKLTAEQEDMMVRFTNVFQQTYTRFLDLQKAEAQTREAQIEASLERVRSRSMAMHKSDELADLSFELVKQVQALGVPTWFCAFNIYDDDTKGSIEWGSNGEGVFPNYRTPREGVFLRYYEAGQKGETLLINEIGEDECPAHYEYLCSLPGVGDQLLQMKAAGIPFPSSQIDHVAFFKYGYVLFITFEPAPESHEVFKRFANVFEQTYTRFLDLQKAEAQAREAQIEAAVERVRAEAMAMHATADFGKVVKKLHTEVQSLEIEGLSGAVIMFFDENEILTTYDFSSPGNFADPKSQTIRYDAKKYPQIGVYPLKKWKEGHSYFVLDYDLKKLKAAIVEWEDVDVNIAKTFKTAIASGHLKHQWDACGRLSNGILAFDMVQPPDDDVRRITIKMTHAFEQAYTRFLDLQKAEAQTKEAQIEAALEKVRSRSLAMLKPDEMVEVVRVIVEKLLELGVVLDANGVVLCTYFDDSKDVLHWLVSPDFSFAGRYLLPYFDHPIFNDAWESRMSGAPYFSKAFTIEEKNSFWKYAFENTDYKNFPEDFKQWVFQNDKHTLSFAWQKNSAILIPSHTGIVPDETQREILKRFSNVFEQAYVRFLDLQKAESRAREAKIESALDRVRSHSMGMQSSKDLSKVTTEMFDQLRQFGGNLYGAGIVFCDKHEGHVEQWHSVPGGGMLTPMIVPYDLDHIHQYRYDQWKKGAELFSIEITGDVIEGHFEKLFSLPSAQKVLEDFASQNIPMPKTPSWEIDYGASFNQGYLLVSAIERFEEASILPRFAKVFEQAYIRFLDLEKAEAQAAIAKKQSQEIEIAYENLKATQKQLIQSEKMASLGELTAGIAHEIQNPLNFVNNFSDVSSEMIDEMQEEISKGDLEEIKAISNDIKQNLNKISHHGNRASSIVKGMLDHSRANTGEKVLTDINALCDEYLRLSYHGLRAKDSSFNASFEFHFDESLPKIKVIPQDIGRVLLNVINNAFFAVDAKAKANAQPLTPKENPARQMSTGQSADSPLGARGARGENSNTPPPSPKGATARDSDKQYKPVVILTTKHLLTAEANAKEVNNLPAGEAGSTIITISDNGIGMSQETIDKVFQPFFTTKPAGQGTGLGMSISYDIITKGHGGTIEVKSKEGEGTTFIIELTDSN